VVGRAHARTDAGKHYNLGLLARHEGVTKHHGQLALPEGNVLALGCLSSLSVEGSYTLFKTKKGLVDLCALCLALLVVAHAVLSSLTSCQVDEQELSTLSYTLFLYLDLRDRMTSA